MPTAFPANRSALLPSPAEREAWRYRVFLSYSHSDTKWARWLMRKLEGYRVSTRFHGRRAPIGEVGPRIAPVFRDRDELPTTSDLGETIRTALRQSATLVAICSRPSAQSRWVREEIVEFKRLGGQRRIFAFIIDGEPKIAGAADDCFSPALRFDLGPDGNLSDVPAEVVAADARPHGDGPKLAFIRLVAGLLGVGFDELRQRELQRRNRRLTLIAAGSACGMAVTLGLAAIAWQARNDARRRQEQGEELLAFLLSDMKSRLQKADKLDALEEVGARMLAYFQSLDPRDLTDRTLTQQARALTQIGQIRVAQLRYSPASDAFAAAYQRLGALVDRHPQDRDMLFERAQAEYWIAHVHWKRGQLDPAETWAARYRDTAVALSRLDPGNAKFQSEVVSGHHNLAVLQLERSNLAAARKGFAGELLALEKLSASNPADRDLTFRMANIVSFLGTTAERDGDFAEAVRQFGEQARRLEALSQLDDNPRWRKALADALARQSSVLSVSGQTSASLDLRRKAQSNYDALLAYDPANREWQVASLNSGLWQTILVARKQEANMALRAAEESLAGIQALAKAESSNRAAAALLVAAWRHVAELRCQLGHPEALEAANQALGISKASLGKSGTAEAELADHARTCITAGMAAELRGDASSARQLWQEALNLVESRSRNSRNWRLLDPLARALLLLGRTEEGRAVIERLNRLGYQPLEPWPGASVARQSVSKP